MQGANRKVFQAVSYEVIAILCIAPAFYLFYEGGLADSTALSIVISTIAVAWNMVFNYTFEAWESRRAKRERTLGRRVIHSVGFEGGMTVLLLPVLSAWLDITLFEALLANFALFLFFLCYAFIFQYVFDKLFDVPDSAKSLEHKSRPSEPISSVVTSSKDLP